MKKKAILLFLSWFLILECLAGCARQDYSYFMEVGNYEISKEEYALLAYDNIAAAAREYGAQKGVDVNTTDFWEKKIDGAAPIDRVKQLTNEEAVYQKGIQILAKECGLIDEIGYDAFLKQYEEENQLRKEKKESGGVVYGPLELTVSQYYSYRQSQLEQALTEYVEQEIITVTDQDMEAYYPVVKEQEGKKNFQAELRLAVWRDSGEHGDQAVEAWIKDNGITGDLPEQIKRELGIDVEVESMTVDTLELGKENLLLDRVVMTVFDTEPGQTTEAIEYSDGQMAVIEVLAKEYVPFGDYESNKDYIEYLLREKKAGEYIENEIGKLEVTKGKAYDILSYQDIIK